MFETTEIMYAENGFAIAKGFWDGDKDVLRTACRWTIGSGYPVGRGGNKEAWLLLPDDILVNNNVGLTCLVLMKNKG